MLHAHRPRMSCRCCSGSRTARAPVKVHTMTSQSLPSMASARRIPRRVSSSASECSCVLVPWTRHL
eukprot:scaffold287_cov119-Isochrysis_galbana.AAC.4